MQNTQVHYKRRKETSPFFLECTVIFKLRSSYGQGKVLQGTFSFQATISCFSSGSNTSVLSAYEKMIYFYAYVSLSLILFTDLLH